MINEKIIIDELQRRVTNLDALGEREFIRLNFPEQYKIIGIYEGLITFIKDRVKEYEKEQDLPVYVPMHPLKGKWEVNEYSLMDILNRGDVEDTKSFLNCGHMTKVAAEIKCDKLNGCPDRTLDKVKNGTYYEKDS